MLVAGYLKTLRMSEHQLQMLLPIILLWRTRPVGSLHQAKGIGQQLEFLV
jgi:hypothetical protein